MRVVPAYRMAPRMKKDRPIGRSFKRARLSYGAIVIWLICTPPLSTFT